MFGAVGQLAHQPLIRNTHRPAIPPGRASSNPRPRSHGATVHVGYDHASVIAQPRRTRSANRSTSSSIASSSTGSRAASAERRDRELAAGSTPRRSRDASTGGSSRLATTAPNGASSASSDGSSARSAATSGSIVKSEISKRRSDRSGADSLRQSLLRSTSTSSLDHTPPAPFVACVESRSTRAGTPPATTAGCDGARDDAACRDHGAGADAAARQDGDTTGEPRAVLDRDRCRLDDRTACAEDAVGDHAVRPDVDAIPDLDPLRDVDQGREVDERAGADDEPRAR